MLIHTLRLGIAEIIPKFGLITLPGLASSLPGLASSLPGLASSLPGLKSSLPGLALSLPGLALTLPDHHHHLYYEYQN